MIYGSAQQECKNGSFSEALWQGSMAELGSEYILTGLLNSWPVLAYCLQTVLDISCC